MKIHVLVRLADVDRTTDWREIDVPDGKPNDIETLNKAIKLAEKMPDVEICLEASFVAGGVVT